MCNNGECIFLKDGYYERSHDIDCDKFLEQCEQYNNLKESFLKLHSECNRLFKILREIKKED